MLLHVVVVCKSRHTSRYCVWRRPHEYKQGTW